MADNKDNQKKLEQNSECSTEDNKEKSKKPTERKGRLKFKKEDMIEIKFNF